MAGLSILQVVQLVASALGIAVILTGLVAFIIRLDGRITLVQTLLKEKFEAIENRFEGMEKVVTAALGSRNDAPSAGSVPHLTPQRAGRGRRPRS
jgi:predicted DNA repair protein MutK